MSESGLPARLEPDRYRAGAGRWAGTVAIETLPRLRALLAEPGGSAAVELTAGRGEGGHDVVAGRVQAEVALVCQRCLQVYHQRLEGEFRLAAVRDEAQALDLPEALEPLLYEGAGVATTELVEDELLLALPAIPRHPEELGCQAPPHGAGWTPEGSGPFAGLRRLRGEDG